jgi:sugar lactone lactonase YvrE
VTGIPVEVALEARARLGESPLWDPRTSCLVWVDILAGTVNTWNPGGSSTTSVSVGRHVSAVGLRRTGGFVLAVREGFAFLSGERLESGPAPLADIPAQRMNDGKCDPEGRFVAGTMTYDLSPGAARLYRLHPDGGLTELLGDLGLSNGLGWSPDGTRFYLADSLSRRIDCFAYEQEGAPLSDRRVFATVEEADGYPDGLTIDVDGALWVALWGGGRVRRYTPRGEVDLEIPVPTALVTSCTFGGTDLADLYITTAAEGTGGPPDPLGGAIFVARPGPTGLPPSAFVG